MWLLAAAALVLFATMPSAVVLADAVMSSARTLVVEANGQRIVLRQASDGTWSTRGEPGGEPTAYAIERAVGDLGAGTSTPLRVTLDGVTVSVERARVHNVARRSVLAGQWAWRTSGRVVRSGTSTSQGDALGDAFVAAGVRVT